jgi:hypothetical protein
MCVIDKQQESTGEFSKRLLTIIACGRRNHGRRRRKRIIGYGWPIKPDNGQPAAINGGKQMSDECALARASVSGERYNSSAASQRQADRGHRPTMSRRLDIVTSNASS